MKRKKEERTKCIERTVFKNESRKTDENFINKNKISFEIINKRYVEEEGSEGKNKEEQ